MNERIDELMIQAGIFKPKEFYQHIDAFQLEKFAELLIQKCVDISDDYVKDCNCEEHVNCKHPRSAIGRKIREYFGVEE
jgi:hypothetical protein